MATKKYLDKDGFQYFWGKIKAWGNSVFAPIAHTHTSYAVKHSYTVAANAAKNWYRIANASTSQLDTTKPIRAQFIVTAYNTSYAADYYETWFVNAIVFGRQAHIIVFGNSNVPFSQARILYENTVADIDTNDRPAIDLYLNYVLPNGTTKIEVEEIYNSGWTFVSDGQLAASTVPSGFESIASAPRNTGVNNSTYADYANYLNRQINNITAAFTLADSWLYRSRTLNCTGTFTITIPSLNSGYMWCVIKNKNTSSGVITLHPSTTSVLIDGSNADIKLQPMEYVCIHSAGANNYSLIADGRWKSQKANDADVVHIASTEIVTGAKTFSSEVKISSVNALRIKSSNYGAFFRNDNNAFYLLVTASGDADGTWTTARPLTVNLATGVCSINGNSATASAVAWSGVTSKPTTIAGYGITDAKIANGTITLGSSSITPLTSVPEIINGVKTFTSQIVKSTSEYTLDYDVGSSYIEPGVLLYKNTANNTDLAYLFFGRYSDGANAFRLRTKNSDDSIWGDLGVYCASNGYVYAAIASGSGGSVLPPDNENSGTLATTEWVRRYCETTKGYITSSDNITGNAATVTGTAGTSALSWDTEVTLATIGGNAVKAKLPANPNTNTTYTFATGDSNGQIKVTPSDGSAQNIDVKGLGSAAFTESASYLNRSSNNSVTSFHFFHRDVANSGICFGGGDGTTNGAYVSLYGQTASNAGKVLIHAKSSSADSELALVPGGTASWKGQAIQTSSDERIKTPISNVSNDILDAWEDVQWGEFKFLDAVAEKGDNARFHVGLIAQAVHRAFEKHGADILKYGILCHEKQDAAENEPAVDLWMVRYTEALCMEATYQRRRANRLEARIALLEERLSALEAENPK